MTTQTLTMERPVDKVQQVKQEAAQAEADLEQIENLELEDSKKKKKKISRKKKLEFVFAVGKGEEFSFSRDELIAALFPDKADLLFKPNKTFFERLQVVELWRKTKQVISKLRANSETFVVPKLVNLEWRYFVVKSERDLESYNFILDKIIEALKKRKRLGKKAIE